MTMMTALMMTITLTMTMVMTPRIYHNFSEAEELYREEELESLRELLKERNNWLLRHLGCGIGALVLIWMMKSSPGMEIPDSLATAVAIYAATSLFFATLESLLAQRITGFLTAVPARIKARGQW